MEKLRQEPEPQNGLPEKRRENVCSTAEKIYSGIMVGIGTVLADDPMLTCRLENAQNPVRIICDSSLRIPLDSNIVKTAKEVPTIIACTISKEGKRKIKTGFNYRRKDRKVTAGRMRSDPYRKKQNRSESERTDEAAWRKRHRQHPVRGREQPELFGTTGRDRIQSRNLYRTKDIRRRTGKDIGWRNRRRRAGAGIFLKNPKITQIEQDILMEWEVGTCSRGIVEEIGKIAGIQKGAKSAVLTIQADKVLEDVHIGDSIAVNGVCLTVTSFEKIPTPQM